MKNIFIAIISVLILSINSSCIYSKKTADANCVDDYYGYYNYKDKNVLDIIKNFPDLKEMSNKYFDSIINEGVIYEKINQKQIVAIPESELLNNPNLKDNIVMYVMGYTVNNNIKQYLVFELTGGCNRSAYVINQINEKITSAFLAHHNSNSGFDYKSINTKVISINNYKVIEFSSYDKIDKHGRSTSTCDHSLKLSSNGFLEHIKN